MLDTLLELMKGLLNAPDLVLVAIILVSAALGASRGLMRTVTNGLGRMAALAGAAAAARMIAPVLARFIVNPIVGDIFEVRASDLLSRSPELAKAVQKGATDMAAEMAQSLAFFLLFFIFLIVMNILVHAVSKALQLVTRIGPIGFLDGLGGFALGGVLGLVMCFLGLLALTIFAPGVFGELGWLSPTKITETTLTARLISLIPKF